MLLKRSEKSKCWDEPEAAINGGLTVSYPGAVAMAKARSAGVLPSTDPDTAPVRKVFKNGFRSRT